MTTSVTPTIINEGPSKVIVQFVIQSDGTDGELTNQVVFNALTDLGQPMDPTVQLSINQMWYNLTWFDLEIKFNALNPVTGWMVSRDPGDSYMDFRYFGGIKDRSTVDFDNKILFSTSGLADSTKSVGVIVIEFKKN